MDQSRTASTHTASAHAAADGSPRTERGGMRLPRRAAGGVFAVGVLASCLASVGGTAFAATGTRTAPAPVAAPGSAPKTFTEQQDVEAFVGAGYTSTDALDLAVIWSNPSIQDTKVTAGAFLLGHEALPFAPKAAPKTYTRAQDVAAFVTSGYGYQDALELAAVWASPSVSNAKASAGAKLLAGQDLPKIPKTFTRAQDVAAFTASGYDHHDAVRLAYLWHTGSVHAAKVQAGIKLLAGDSLLIRP